MSLEGGLAGILPEPSRLTHDAMFGPDFAKVAFTVRDVPAFGYEIYRLTEDADATQDGVSVAYDGDTATLENDHYRVDIDGSAGAVASLYDKDIDREFVPDDEVFGGLTIETEAPHGMSAWIRGQVVETEDLNSGWRVEVTEDGPARGAIRCTRSYRDSEVAVTIRLAGGAGPWTGPWTLTGGRPATTRRAYPFCRSVSRPASPIPNSHTTSRLARRSATRRGATSPPGVGRRQ